MDEISKSTDALAIEEGSHCNALPEVTSPLKKRVIQPTVEELAAQEKLSELQQIKDYTKLHSKS